ncbi:MAG: hypothetical protein NC248_09885 [Bacteroides sp.]|nr:hypothetical protein [Bacteroides sp.]MCM1390420.1 hypothetical protein [Bacteroides sp.]
MTSDGEARWSSNLGVSDRILFFDTNPARKINNVSVVLVKSKINDKYVYIHIAGYLRDGNNDARAIDKAYYNTSQSKNPAFMGILQATIHEGPNSKKYYFGYTDNGNYNKMAASVRAVKRQTGAY